MRIKSFGFSRITTKELRIAASSRSYNFDCARAIILCDDCPFVGGDCCDNYIDQAMGQLARAELRRRLSDEKR